MIVSFGLPCSFCGGPTVAHCVDAHCGWSRCPRCHSYGFPGVNYVQWRKDDYQNPFGLLDVEVAEPERKMPQWLEQVYGRNRNNEVEE